MTSRSTSPRRRHILSSINPESSSRGRRTRSRSRSRSQSPRATTETDSHPAVKQEDASTESKPRRRRHHHRSRSRSRSPKAEDPGDGGQDDDDPLRPRSKRFRFKKPSSSRREKHHDEQTSSSRRKHRRRHRSPTPPNPHEPRALSPDTAFRESLFDAMADDEGAAYWQGVYGQPVHEYAAEAGAARGELEQMDEEEYATYVRRRMWEKTHEGLLEERARREEARKRKEEEKRQSAREERRRERVRREMEASLRRGEERRARKDWKARWEGYVAGWAAWDVAGAGDRDAEKLPWPVESGRRRDVREEGAVRRFFDLALDAGGEDVSESGIAGRLRDERVRWHPDKIQRRSKDGQVDKEVLADVTAVFQVVDAMWNEHRKGR